MGDLYWNQKQWKIGSIRKEEEGRSASFEAGRHFFFFDSRTLMNQAGEAPQCDKISQSRVK